MAVVWIAEGCVARATFAAVPAQTETDAYIAGIRKRIGWHTFRHTYSTLLIANGENVKVVQELMRHASTRFTVEVYTQARIEVKRRAQRRLVHTMLLDENDGLAPAIPGGSDVAV